MKSTSVRLAPVKFERCISALAKTAPWASMRLKSVRYASIRSNLAPLALEPASEARTSVAFSRFAARRLVSRRSVEVKSTSDRIGAAEVGAAQDDQLLLAVLPIDPGRRVGPAIRRRPTPRPRQRQRWNAPTKRQQTQSTQRWPQFSDRLKHRLVPSQTCCRCGPSYQSGLGGVISPGACDDAARCSGLPELVEPDVELRGSRRRHGVDAPRALGVGH